MTKYPAQTMTPGDDSDPQMQRLLGYLSEGPLPSPSAHVLERAKSLGARPLPQRPGMVQQSLEMIARLISDSRTTPALAGFRGSPREAHLIYASDVGEIDIHIEPASLEQSGKPVRILAQVETEQHPTSARLHRTDEVTVAETAIDIRGMFSLEAPSGTYDLTIYLEHNTLRISSLEL